MTLSLEEEEEERTRENLFAHLIQHRTFIVCEEKKKRKKFIWTQKLFHSLGLSKNLGP